MIPISETIRYMLDKTTNQTSNMTKKLYGLTKGTELEKMITAAANAEANGTKQYYALARMAREQNLPEEVSDTLEKLADQESNHAGFYAMLNGTYQEDIYAIMERSAKGEYAAEKALKPLADALRQMGSEEAAEQVEEFIRQEVHHGVVLEELVRKYRK